MGQSAPSAAAAESAGGQENMLQQVMGLPMEPEAYPMSDLSFPQLKDLPSQHQRASRSRKGDILAGARPPAELAPLLSTAGYLQGVLSRLPDVDPSHLAVKVRCT